MSWIDDLGVKAANAGSGQVNLTGDELRTLLQLALTTAAAAGVASFNTRTGAVTLTGADVTGAGGALLASPTFTGTPAAPTAAPGTNTTQLATTAFVAAAASGLTTTGSLTGATSFTQAFTKGVEVGADTSENGVINFRNSADTSVIVASSTAAKALKIDNTGHDVIVGINGAAQTGYSLYVSATPVGFAELHIADATTTITQPAANQMLLTASAGVIITGGFITNPFVLKTADYTLTSSDFAINADGSSNTVEITGGGNDGQIFVIRAVSVANAVTVAGVNGGSYTFVTAKDSIMVMRDANSGELFLMAEYKQ